MRIEKIFIIFNHLYFDCSKENDFLLSKDFILNKEDINNIMNRNPMRKFGKINIFYNIPNNYINFFILINQDGYFYEIYHIIKDVFPCLISKNNFQLQKLVRINVINLKKAVNRYNKIKNQLLFFNQFYKIFLALDPSDKDFLSSLKENNILLNNSRKKYGEAGCSLSHISIIKNFLNSDEKYCIIMEDDCKIIQRIPQKVLYYDKIFNMKVDILYLSNRVKCNKKGEIISGVGTESYVIDRKGAKKILKICDNIDCGIDLRYQSHFPNYFRKNHKHNNSDIILYGIKSNIPYVLHDDNGISYINNTHTI
jgi:GR25 family glycosyltransferase involved in LPS biosynthesis